MLESPTIVKLQRWAKLYLAHLKRLNLDLIESGHRAADALATIGMGRGFFPADAVTVLPDFSGMKIELQVYGQAQEFDLLIT